MAKKKRCTLMFKYFLYFIVILIVIFIIKCLVLIVTTHEWGISWDTDWLEYEIDNKLKGTSWSVEDLKIIDREKAILAVSKINGPDNKYEFFIYKTKNGGKTWFQIYSGDQKIRSLSLPNDKNDKLVYIVKNNFTYKEARVVKNSTFMKLMDDGARWKSFPPITPIIAEMVFLNENIGLAIGDINADTTEDGLFITYDGGKNWRVLKTKYEIDETATLYLALWHGPQLSANSKGDICTPLKDYLICLNILNDTKDYIKIPAGLEISALNHDDKGRLWIAGRLEKKPVLFLIEKNNIKKIVIPSKLERPTIRYIHIYEGKISAVITEAGTILGVSKYIYFADEFTNKWTIKELSFLRGGLPVRLFKNEYIFFTGHMGEMLKRYIK